MRKGMLWSLDAGKYKKGRLSLRASRKEDSPDVSPGKPMLES